MAGCTTINAPPAVLQTHDEQTHFERCARGSVAWPRLSSLACTADAADGRKMEKSSQNCIKHIHGDADRKPSSVDGGNNLCVAINYGIRKAGRIIS
jgi:hypothetical protein